MSHARSHILLALIAGTGIWAFAQEPGWYLGANFGRSKAAFDNAKLSREIFGSTITDSSFTNRDRASGYKLFTGYQVNTFLGMELGYYDLGRFSFSAVTAPPGTLEGTITTRGLFFDFVGSIPFTSRFSGFARAGWNYGETRDTFAATGAVAVVDNSLRTRDTNFKFGLGLEYDFTPMFGLRAEGERYRFNDAVRNKGEVDYLSVGFIVRFGRSDRSSAPAVQQAMAPPRDTPPTYEAPPPILVIVPVPPATQKYCTILDLQFEVDRGDIQRESLERLAVVGTFLNKYPATTAVIEGHTDNVGTDDHNLALSQQRADSVVTYLVETAHIDRSRLRAIGYGDTRPLASNETEAGKRMNRRIGAVIACATDVEGLPVVPARMTMALALEFDRNSAVVRSPYREPLAQVAQVLKDHPGMTASVEGHTGNLQASRELTQQISRERAENVVTVLVEEFGIARNRLTAEGFGRTRRTAYNTSAEGQQENRRVNIILSYPAGTDTRASGRTTP
jgi:OOP family OmpA-OmpF porin